MTALAILAGLAYAWWPDQNRYRPIQPFERGTVTQALDSASFIVGRTPALQDGQIVQGQSSIWASTSKPPTRDHPQLALVLIPKRDLDRDLEPSPPGCSRSTARRRPGQGTTRPSP